MMFAKALLFGAMLLLTYYSIVFWSIALHYP